MSSLQQTGEPRVSVLMTAFNRGKYISAAIESVLHSSLTNLELIILDDCSTDDTFAIAERYSITDERIRLYKNENNLGQFKNRNKAISLARGTFIKFLDSDDEIGPNGLSKMVSAMESFPCAGIGVPVRIKQPDFKPFSLSPEQSVVRHFSGDNHLCYGPTGTIFSRDALNHVGLFEPVYGILADTLLNIKLASCYETVFFEEGLFHWRRHDEQVTEEQEDDVRMIGERYRINEAALSYAHSPLTDSQKNIIRNNFVKINTKHVLSHMMKRKFADASSIAGRTQLSIGKIVRAVFMSKKTGLLS